MTTSCEKFNLVLSNSYIKGAECRLEWAMDTISSRRILSVSSAPYPTAHRISSPCFGYRQYPLLTLPLLPIYGFLSGRALSRRVPTRPTADAAGIP
jgi:hypothetical protein